MKDSIPLKKDYTNNSLLVVNPQGKIRRIYVPFRVLCIKGTGSIVANAWVYVQQISMNINNQLIYFIAGEFHVYDSFRIFINF